MKTTVLLIISLFAHCFPQAQNLPEGKIVFISEYGDRKWKICTIDADGKNEKILTPDSSKYNVPSFLHDGKKIVFYNSTSDGYDIFVMDADGKNMQQLTHYKSAYFPRWSPDGKWIAFEGPIEGDGELYIIHPDGTGLRRLTYSKGLDRNPGWSPDSRHIAFASTRDGNYEIYITSIDSPFEVKRITNTPDVVEKFPAWSPDGKKIAFHLQSRQDNKSHEYAIYVMNTDGTERKKIIDDSEMASWSPDGRYLVLDYQPKGTNSEIYIVSVENGQLVKITNNGRRNYMPSWSPK